MLGVNDRVVNISMNTQGKMHKRYVALSFHRIREVIAAKIIFYHLINGIINPSDILSKHWANHCVRST